VVTPSRVAAKVLASARLIANRERAGAWLVGGTIRDRLLGRPVADIDVVVAPPLTPAQLTSRVAAELGLPHFVLSDRFNTHRLVWPGGHLDVTALRGDTILADLSLRDFTVNAMGEPLEGGDIIDPHGGRADTAAARLCEVSGRIFSDDPLRLLRVARFSLTLGFRPTSGLVRLAQMSAHLLPRVAPERAWAEVAVTLEAGPGAQPAQLWDDLGLLAVLFPEVKALQNVRQSTNHHLDVYGHTLEALEHVERLMAEPESVFPDSAAAVRFRLGIPVDGGISRQAAMRLAVLLHDMAKPDTRTIDALGRLSFWGHEEKGAPLARDVCRRLHTSNAVAGLVEAVVGKHLLLGFLQNKKPLWDHDVVGFLWATAPWEPEVIMACVADRLATHGPMTAQRFINRHLTLARHLMWSWMERRRQGVPPLPLPGDEIGRRVGVQPGPELGRLLRRLRLLWEAGEIADEEGLLCLARAVLQQGNPRGRGII